MDFYLEDEFINKRLFSRMLKNVKEEQVNKTIDEINYLNEIQSSVLSRSQNHYDISENESRQLEFLQKLKTARKFDKIRKNFKN